MSAPRKRLSDILNGTSQGFKDIWSQTAPAPELAPVPAGQYVVSTIGSRLDLATTGTPFYELTFEIAEGDYSGRKLWARFYLTAAALPMSRRELAKLGITDPGQLEQPLPARFRLKVRVALRVGDDGLQRNEVRGIVEVLGVEPLVEAAPEAPGGHTPDPFAPGSEESPL